MSNDSTVKMVTQDLSNNCVSACIAMVTGFDLSRVTDEFHNEYHDGEVCMHDYLDLAGIKFNKFYSGSRCTLRRGFVYMLAVPSLNYVGGLHEIIVDFSGETPAIFDPAPNDKNRYTEFGKPGSGGLCSWAIDAEIPAEELAEWRLFHNGGRS